jgi:xylulokinase
VRENEPEIFRQTRCVLLPKDYVRLLMTGEKAGMFGQRGHLVA